MFIHNHTGKMWLYYLWGIYFITNIAGAVIFKQMLGMGGFSHTPYIRGMFILFLVLGITFIWLPLYMMNQQVEIRRGDLAVGVIVSMFIGYSTIIGMVNANTWTYILSDTAYLAAGLGIYLLTRFGDIHLHMRERYLVPASALLAALLLGLYFLSSWVPVTLLIVFVGLFLYALYTVHTGALLLQLGPLVFLLISSNRSLLLTVIVMVLVLLLVLLIKNRWKPILHFVFGFSLLGLVAVLAGDNVMAILGIDFYATALGRRIEVMMGLGGSSGISLGEDVTIGQRLYEVEVIVETLGSNPLFWLFGYGAGGTIDMSGSLDPSVTSAALLGMTEVHNVHFLHGALLFRYGLFGLAVVAGLVWRLFTTAVKYDDHSLIFANLLALSLIVYSYSSSSYLLVEPLLWFLLAWRVTRMEWLKGQNETIAGARQPALKKEGMMKDSFRIQDLMHMVKKRIKLLSLVMLAALSAGAVYTWFIAEPEYEASTQILVTPDVGESETPASEDWQSSRELVNTYNTLLTSPAIIEPAVQNLSVARTEEAVQSQLTVAAENESQIATVTVRDTDPEAAVAIVNTVTETFEQEVPSIMSVDNVSILSEAEMKDISEPVSPQPLLYMGASLFGGLLGGLGLVLLLEMMNNKIKTEEELASVLGLPILGSVNTPSDKEVAEKTEEDMSPQPVPVIPLRSEIKSEAGEKIKQKV
ncbi:YveK family protein [Marinococcus luteus]|uniref:YveK family protein n=1 Tax=Marinococcus luteus TaxID=1122204 RepID=UPI002ACC9EC3|nr:Wzz/FepE/Etk N-terminal domain-containing protein [Marinococcus luteus]MDZ5784217.1 Wzz/FepE/Etk N-terminal domain-containing protein [Marinococcus luteus]